MLSGSIEIHVCQLGNDLLFSFYISPALRFKFISIAHVNYKSPLNTFAFTRRSLIHRSVSLLSSLTSVWLNRRKTNHADELNHWKPRPMMMTTMSRFPKHNITESQQTDDDNMPPIIIGWKAFAAVVEFSQLLHASEESWMINWKWVRALLSFAVQFSRREVPSMMGFITDWSSGRRWGARSVRIELDEKWKSRIDVY